MGDGSEDALRQIRRTSLWAVDEVVRDTARKRALNNNPANSKGGKREGAGRPAGKVSAATLVIRELAKQHSEDAMIALVDMMIDKETPAASRITAIKEVLERAHGKSTSFITSEFDPPLSSMTPKDSLSTITDKVTQNLISVEDGTKLTSMIESRMRAVEMADLEERLKKLEDQS